MTFKNRKELYTRCYILYNIIQYYTISTTSLNYMPKY